MRPHFLARGFARFHVASEYGFAMWRAYARAGSLDLQASDSVD